MAQSTQWDHVKLGQFTLPLLLDRLIPLDGQPVLCTFFQQKLTTAFLDLAERENGVQECKQEVTIIISHIKKWQKF